MIRLPRGLVITLGSSALAMALSVVQFFEGVRYTAYADTGGVWTICYGHTGGVQPGQVATPTECIDYLKADLAVATAAVERLISAPLPATRKAGLISFTLNLGSGTLARSSVRRELNAGNPAAACAVIDRYVFVAGKDCRLAGSNCAGIVTRRNVERWLCEAEL